MEAAAERAVPRGRLRERGHVRVPARRRRALLLHRAERAPAGRAPGHRARAPGIDLVREQLRVAAGEPLALTGRAPRRGHAIEIRLNAEDPARDFVPAPGRIERFRPPLGPGVRVDTHLEDGAVVPPYYDSLLAKLVVWDVDRPAAIARALRALEELEIEGVPTTRELALDILRSDEFRAGDYSTGFLAEMPARRARPVTDTHVHPGGRRDDHGRAGGALAGRRPRRREASTARASGVRGARSTSTSTRDARGCRSSSPSARALVLPDVAHEVQQPRRRVAAGDVRPRVGGVDVAIEELDA